MLNIIIPMAGAGSRFANEGYTLPKPLIPIHARPMIEIVINNLRPCIEHKFIFICQDAHVRNYGLGDILRRSSPQCEIVCIDGITDGAACTVLCAAHYIDNDTPLMIANCDQYIDHDINAYLDFVFAASANHSGVIMTMEDTADKWSYVKFDASNEVEFIAEKKVVSNDATTGIYNFTRGREFVTAAQSMISQNQRVNNEFYVAPVYNMLIQAGRRISTYSIGGVTDGMYGLGTPEDLESFLAHDISKKATAW